MYKEQIDKMEEACGVFGIYGPNMDVAQLTYYGLYALQHRGQESAGIAVSDGQGINLHKDMGLVSEVFNEDILCKLNGYMAIGHVRYSTTGASLAINAQPLVFRYLKGSIALAHNGNLTNANELRDKLAANGSVFQSTIDSEVIVNLIARYGQGSIEEALMKCMIDIKGSYSLVVMTEEKIVGVRDPFGNRPLCLGRLQDAYVLASETCALDTLGATFIRDIEPGEIVTIDKDGVKSHRILPNNEPAVCIFEYIYFARPDSVIDNISVLQARRAMGKELATEHVLDVDVVIPVPDSGTASAIGYAEALGLPFELGLMKNRYVGRTFIQPAQELRSLGVRLKLNPIRRVIEGKRVAMVDDSIVRGTTSKKIVEMLKQNGAKEVHMLVSSPAVKYPCYYGIDTSEREQLIASENSLEEIRKYINCDSLHYLSLEGLMKAMGRDKGFCTACLNGNYPIPLPNLKELGKHILETPKDNPHNRKGGASCGRLKN